MITEALEFCPKDAKDWEKWLSKNHNIGKGVWLIQYKTNTEKFNISYPDALDIALCYGWIDSTIKPIDEEKYKRYFSKRKKNSVWSKVNKIKVEKLIKDGRMTSYGMNAIETAKQNGCYDLYNELHEGIAPKELREIFKKDNKIKKAFESLTIKDKRLLLYKFVTLKTEQAKERSLKEIVEYLKKLDLKD